MSKPADAEVILQVMYNMIDKRKEQGRKSIAFFLSNCYKKVDMIIQCYAFEMYIDWLIALLTFSLQMQQQVAIRDFLL